MPNIIIYYYVIFYHDHFKRSSNHVFFKFAYMFTEKKQVKTKKSFSFNQTFFGDLELSCKVFSLN